MVKTQTESVTEKIIDTTFLISKNQFVKEIECQKQNSKNTVIFAGHYQTISISENGQTTTYSTTRIGMGLVRLLEKAEIKK